MTDRERIAHLLRRFGLGAGTVEMAKYEALGFSGTLDKLLNYDKVDEAFPINPTELYYEPDKTDIYVDPYRTGAWWSLRLMMSERPLEQQLTLFWHGHLVAGAEKVEFGPTMLEYLETLRVLGAGDFATLLSATSKTVAMIKYLDGDLNVKGYPNENFGREVMELFTLGIGNYTEQDVKEAARAFTGWGVRYVMYEGGAEALQSRLKASIAKGDPMIAAYYSWACHDDGPKTILGETKNFGFDDTLAMLAGRVETARHLGKKLWEFFAYPDPAKPVIDHLAATYQSSGGNIRAVLTEMSKMDEFWSDACVRQKVKSPVDFTMSIARQFNLKTLLLNARGAVSNPTTPLNAWPRGTGGLWMGTMMNMGQTLLYPPNVKGWDGGTAWISANTMTERIKLANTLFNVGTTDKGLAAWVSGQVMGRKPQSDIEGLQFFLDHFDADVFGLEKKKMLLAAFSKEGGIAGLAKPETASNIFGEVGRMVFGSPEFQMC
jgi:uncharacterized protein (DUF1800 family)